jgi:hypothetical protein
VADVKRHEFHKRDMEGLSMSSSGYTIGVGRN